MRKEMFLLIAVFSMSGAWAQASNAVEMNLKSPRTSPHIAPTITLEFKGCIHPFEALDQCERIYCDKNRAVLGGEKENQERCENNLFEPIACFCLR